MAEDEKGPLQGSFRWQGMMSCAGLFLGLLESDVLAELGRVFLELDLALDFLLVLARKISLASLFIAQNDECVL